MKVFLTVIVKVKPDYYEEMKKLFMSLPEKSMQEEACIRYDVYEDSNDANTFIFQELWMNKEGLEVHNKQSYSQKFFDSFDKLQGEPVLYLSH